MGAWDSLTLASSTMKGIAPVDLMDPDTGIFDPDRLTTDYVSAAKRYIQTRLMKEMPTFISEADGPEEFLDAAVTINKAHINDLLQEVLAHAFLFLYYDQEMVARNSTFSDRSSIARDRFNEAFQALTQMLRLDAEFLAQSQSTTDSTNLARHAVPIFIG